MKQQARIRLKTTSLLNIPSTYIATPSSLLWWDTTAAAESSQWKWNAFIYFNSATTLPLYNQCTTGNAMGHARRTVTHRHPCVWVCDMRVWASERQSLITFRTQRHKNNKRKWWWRRWAGQCPILPTPTLWLHLFAAAVAAAVDDAQRWTANEQQTAADMKCIKNSQFSDYF